MIVSLARVLHKYIDLTKVVSQNWSFELHLSRVSLVIAQFSLPCQLSGWPDSHWVINGSKNRTCSISSHPSRSLKNVLFSKGNKSMVCSYVS